MDWHFKIRDMSKHNLVRLIECYDRYVQEFYETHDGGSVPVCIGEYLDCDCELLEL